MSTHELALAFVTMGALAAGLGCSAGAPGAGDPELTHKASALSSADLSGLAACQVTTDTDADCIVDPAYPIYSGYTLTVTPDDGSAGFDFAVTTKITGDATADGTPVHLTGYGFKGVWSWKPAVVVEKGAIATKPFSQSAFTFYCTGTCGSTVTQVKKPFGPG
jgi:hypothetical protein